ncbi:putative membrane protein [Acinetobacter baumannii 44362_10]|nr:putative membrane protein [Acinetobacter baumannii 44362_10]
MFELIVPTVLFSSFAISAIGVLLECKVISLLISPVVQ